MCIIVAKEKDKRLPSKEELKNCFTRNDDGAGFMYVDNGKVVIDKGYMTWGAFEKRFDELVKQYNDFKDKALVMHFRIGTSSGNTPQNTHPYPITYKEKELHALHIETDLGVVHNGVIHDYSPKSKTINDTQNFIMRYLYPLYSNFKEFYKVKTIREGIAKITGSKFVFLDTTETIYYVGSFVNETGIQFSNTTYISYKPTYNNYYGNVYNNYYSKWDDDYDYYDYYSSLSRSINKSDSDTKEVKAPTQEVIETEKDDDKDDGVLEVIKLDSEWYFEYKGQVIQVGTKNLYIDDKNMTLYFQRSDGTFVVLQKNTKIYDRNGVQF